MSKLSHILKTMQMMFQSIKAGQGSGMSLTRLEEILDIIRSQSVYTFGKCLCKYSIHHLVHFVKSLNLGVSKINVYHVFKLSALFVHGELPH